MGPPVYNTKIDAFIHYFAFGKYTARLKLSKMKVRNYIYLLETVRS